MYNDYICNEYVMFILIILYSLIYINILHHSSKRSIMNITTHTEAHPKLYDVNDIDAIRNDGKTYAG
jgi:hypothetical protein